MSYHEKWIDIKTNEFWRDYLKSHIYYEAISNKLATLNQDQHEGMQQVMKVAMAAGLTEEFTSVIYLGEL